MSDDLHSWLLREGSDCAHLLELAGKLGEQLLAAGLPCARVWISTMRPHPLHAAQAVEWTDSGSLTRRDVPLARRGEIRITGGPFDNAFETEIFRIHLRDLPIGHAGLNRGLWESGYTEMAGIGLHDGPRRLALHLGDVMYGNIGSRTRLDFTAIGSAVNLAARLEALTAGLGSPLVVSAEFAAEHPEAFVLAGSFPLKGVQAPVEAFVPRS